MNDYRPGFLAAIISCLLILIPSLAFASFDTNLGYGASGSEVISLQQFLISHGFLPADDVTGNFLSATRSAVETFQAQQGITPASGYFGPLTRARVNAIAGSGSGSLLASLEAELQQLEAEILTGTNTNSQCPLPPQPYTSCSGTWSATTDANGCITAWQCSLPTTNTCPTYQPTSCPEGTLIPQGQDANGCQLPPQCVAASSATFTASPSSGEAPLAVSFSGTTPLSGYSIDYGDGSTPSSVFSASCQSSCNTTSSGALQSHTYTSGGTYTATLKDSSGNLLGTATITVSSSNQTSTSTSTNTTTLSFSADQTSGAAPLTVNFTPSDNSTSYAVDFGDASNASRIE